jgi:insulysin
MIAFYNHYINPSSTHRAKVAVYLYAQSTTEGKEKVAELVKALGLPSEASAKIQAALLQPAKRNDVVALRKLVTEELKLPESKAMAILEAAKLPDLSVQVNGAVTGDETDPVPTANGPPVLITDVRAFRASLVASSGARPAKELSAYEDIDSKL